MHATARQLAGTRELTGHTKHGLRKKERESEAVGVCGKGEEGLERERVTESLFVRALNCR